jgi:hypothetical protein
VARTFVLFTLEFTLEGGPSKLRLGGDFHGCGECSAKPQTPSPPFPFWNCNLNLPHYFFDFT